MAEERQRVGPYLVGRELGRGASGVVLEGTDERLGRRVALKALAEGRADTPELRARFEREARILATVSHPHVATVYGAVEQDGRLWLALELLDGETLADRLARGPLPVEDALDVARQIADGLEAAHERGVVHRDLKPGNVGLTADGTVKVLDFGLAKQVGQSPTASTALSTDGQVFGTPLYMSPEQLRGRPVDRRADVWAFGCVLWELLTGERPFQRENAADLVHAILESEPDAERLPPSTPARVRDLLERCLRKDPRRRLRDVGDARVELEAALEERAWARPSPGAAESARGARSSSSTWGLVFVAVVASVLFGVWLGLRVAVTGERASRPLRLVVDVGPGEKRTHPRLSPDGRVLVHERVTGGDASDRFLVRRSLDSFEDEPIPGTRRVDTLTFSPDGERLGIVRALEGGNGFDVVTVRVDGAEPPVFLGPLPEDLSHDGSMAWLDDDRLVLVARPRTLLLYHANEPGRVDEVTVRCDEDRWPHAPDVIAAVPGTSSILASSFQLGERGAFECVVSIDVDTGEQTVVVEKSSCAAWQRSGNLLFTRADVLYSAPYDRDHATLTGDPVLVARGLRAGVWRSGYFHASLHGDFVWLPGGVVGDDLRVSWVEPPGVARPWSDAELPLGDFLELDPTEQFLVVVVVSASGTFELWGSEVATPNLRPLVASHDSDVMGGMVHAATRRLFFCRFDAGGAELRVTSFDDPDEGEALHAVAAEGASLRTPRLADGGRLLTVVEHTPTGHRLLGFDLSGGRPTGPWTIFDGSREQHDVSVSPDGRWVLAGGDVPFQVREVKAGEGASGKSTTLRTGGLRLGAARWLPLDDGDDGDDGDAGYRIVGMVEHRQDLVEIDVRVGADGDLEFGAPRATIRLDDAWISDASALADGRYLAILLDSAALAQDTVQLTIGGLSPADERP